MKWLQRLTAGLAVLEAVAAVRAALKNPASVQVEQVAGPVRAAIQAVEKVEGIDVPEDLVAEIVAADVEIVRRYYATPKA